MDEKIRGMFFGIAVGDALGMPVETFSQERIQEKYPEGIRSYLKPTDHKWFKDSEAGTWTDDTQLSLAVAEALIRAKKFDMDLIAEEHAKAMGDSVKGWGATTKEAIQRLKNGVHWSKSASVSVGGKVRGVGNGVPMKIAPLGAFHFLNKTHWRRAVAESMVFAKMTHPTSMSISAALAHDAAIRYCLSHDAKSFKAKDFIELIVKRSVLAENFIKVRHGEDNITNRFRELHNFNDFDFKSLIESFGEASCYVYNSLPFTYMHFLKDTSFQCVFNVIESGGDTDTNGSMAASLVGALHGMSAIPENLVDSLPQSEVIYDIASRFLEKEN